MKPFLVKTIFFLLLFLASSVKVFAQCNKKVSVHTNHGLNFYRGVLNAFYIVAQQEEPVSIDQVEVNLIVYDTFRVIPLKIERTKDCFYMRTDSIGYLEIKVKLRDTTEIVQLGVRELVVVCKLGAMYGPTTKALKSVTFKAQVGMSALVECCGFDMRCSIKKYDLIRISATNEAKKSTNQGAMFTQETKAIIDLAEKGDIFIFRNIVYSCPSLYNQIGEDLIFEIE